MKSNLQDKGKESQLAAMVADPEIQKELKQINKEFAVSEEYCEIIS